VVGNRVLGGPGGADVYIAGLIWISQHALNSGQGYINCISYATGEMRVGGPIGNCAVGARIQLNDPLNVAVGTGRFGRPTTPDARFTVDQDNPTIASSTGYPMCIPRTDPASATPDGLCPQGNRPVVGNVVAACTAPVTPGVPCSSFTMLKPPVPNPGTLDPTIQAPFEVGDYVTFAGTLVQDCLLTGCPGGGPTAGPWPTAAVGGAAATYISAHTITNNVAIYTDGGSNPAYVSIEVSLIGTGGLVVIGANEAALRTRFEGMTSDVDKGTNPGAANNTFPSQRLINLYGIDLASFTGATSDRYYGVIGVDPGPPTGASKGRWRFRPPCLAFGTIPAKPDKDCVMNQSNTFLPPTREVRAVIGASQNGAALAAFTAPITPASPTAANGIVYGQYHAPIGEYLFPEALPGMAPIPENNFNTMPFLTQGGYTSSAGTIVGQLNPWPSNVLPPPVCIAAAANAGGPYVAASGGTIALTGQSSGSTPLTYSWTADGGTFDNPTLLSPNYTAPTVAVQTVFNLTLIASNICGSSPASTTTVTVAAAGGPVVNLIPNQTVNSGAAGTFNVTGSDPNVPAALPLTWAVSQTGPTALTGLTITSTGPTSATVNYTAPAGLTAPANVTVTVTATNSIGTASVPVSTTVTIVPISLPPVVNPVAAVSVPVGSTDVSLLVTASDPNVPALMPLTYTVTQVPAGTLLFPSGGCALGTTQGNLCVTVSGATTSATISFNAPAAPTSVTLNITVTNSAGLSTTITTTVTVTDVFAITAAEYRSNKQRLIVNVTDQTIDPTIQIFLQPYRCETNLAPCVPVAPGSPVWMYNPDPAAGGLGNLFTGGAGGLYVFDISGVPPPACNLGGQYRTPCGTVSISVVSSKGGSASSVLTRIR